MHRVKEVLPIECEIPTLHTILKLFPKTTHLNKAPFLLKILTKIGLFPSKTMRPPRCDPKQSFTLPSIIIPLMRDTLSYVVKSPMKLWVLEISKYYGSLPTSSNISTLKVPTTWLVSMTCVSKTLSTSLT